MSLWSEDLSTSTLDDVVRSREENRAWSKALRFRTSSLVNSRLAKQISLDEYALQRKVANLDVAECQRRSRILANEIVLRSQRSPANLTTHFEV